MGHWASKKSSLKKYKCRIGRKPFFYETEDEEAIDIDNKKDIFCSVSGGIGVWKNTSINDELSFNLITNPFIYSYQYSTNTNLYVSVVDIPAINDIDGDGESKPLTDALLLIRYLFRFSGDSLVNGAVGPEATRNSAEEIEAYISERVPSS